LRKLCRPAGDTVGHVKVRVALIAVIVMLLAPASSWASLPDEQRQGQSVAGQLEAGAKSCDDLSVEDFDHIGEYVMGRALGSTTLHQAMNRRMRLMMGDQSERRMHELMGKRFAGCLNRTATGGGVTGIGPGMMGGSHGNGGWGAMMRSGDWSWMTGGTWRSMSREDWQRLQRRWMGVTATTSQHHGWSAGALVGTTLGGVLLVAMGVIGVLGLRRRSWRRPRAAHIR